MDLDTAIAIQQGSAPGIALSRHAAAQAVRKGFPLLDVVLAANDPTVIYDNGRYPDQARHIRGSICAVVDLPSQEVVTVYEHCVMTALRADQHDDDARRYADSLAPATA